MSNFHLQYMNGLKLIELGPATSEAQGSRCTHEAQLGIYVCLLFLVMECMPSSSADGEQSVRKLSGNSKSMWRVPGIYTPSATDPWGGADICISHRSRRCYGSPSDQQRKETSNQWRKHLLTFSLE